MASPEPYRSDLPAPTRGASCSATLLWVCAVFISMSLVAGWMSEGFLEADASSHLDNATRSRFESYRFVDIWGRPFCTTVYSLPAWTLGRHGAQAMAMVLALAGALLTRSVARRQGYALADLAALAYLASPLVFLHSFTIMTELPFAFLMALALWLYQRRLLWPTALVVGLMPLARPEGFGMLVAGVVLLGLHRRWLCIPLLLLPLAAWNHTGWLMWGRPRLEELGLIRSWLNWLPGNWPYAGQSAYEPGSIFKLSAMLPLVVPTLFLPALFIGVWQAARQAGWRLASAGWRRATPANQHARLDAIVLVLPLAVLVGHSVLHALGKMASNGEARYLMVAMPMWALLCARGGAWLVDRLKLRRPMLLAGALALAPVLANVAYQVVPLQVADDWRFGRAVVEHVLKRPDVAGQRIAAAHPAFWYYYRHLGGEQRRWIDFTRRTFESAPPGTLLVWDPIYALHNSDRGRLVRPEELTDLGWDLVGDLPALLPGGTPRDPHGAWLLYRKR